MHGYGFKCIEMEKQLISECERRQGKGDAAADDVISLSKVIQKRALGLNNMDQFPASAAALMVRSSLRWNKIRVRST